MRIVLASSSPRRRLLLAQAGFQVLVRPVAVQEAPRSGEMPQETAERLARAKALACAEETLPVVAADTVVALDGRMLGKPRTLHEARAMLHALAGRTHFVHTGIAVRCGRRMLSEVITARVRFRRLVAQEIDAYLASAPVLDKAGAYGIQEGGASFVVGVVGPLDAVIGLPVARVRALLAELA